MLVMVDYVRETTVKKFGKCSGSGFFENFFLLFSFSIVSPANIRLSDGPVPNAGRVEIYSGGAWYSVCDSFFYQQEAQVVCGQLGYQR